MLIISGKTKRIKLRDGDIRVVLINEDSQGAENGMIYNSLKKAADQYGFEVDNYSMYATGDKAQIIYVQVGILATVILSGKTADYVVTGYGTDGGAVLTCNSFPGVIYDHVGNTLDAYTFVQINDGNTVAIPFAEGFGWGSDLNLEYVLERLFYEPSGQGYPRERVVSEQRDKRTLNGVRKAAFREDLVEIFKGLDQELIRDAFAGRKFGELFFGRCKDGRPAAYIRELVG